MSKLTEYLAAVKARCEKAMLEFIAYPRPDVEVLVGIVEALEKELELALRGYDVLLSQARENVEALLPTAPSEDEDEGETLGRRLYDMCRELGGILIPLPDARELALRFRAECVGPWKKLEEAVKELRRANDTRPSPVSGPTLAAAQGALIAAIGVVLNALPDQSEPLRQPQDANSGINAIVGKWPGDETDEQVKEALKDKPRVSDDELGRFAWIKVAELIRRAAEEHEDVNGGAELGAAIRARLLDTKDKQA